MSDRKDRGRRQMVVRDLRHLGDRLLMEEPEHPPSGDPVYDFATKIDDLADEMGKWACSIEGHAPIMDDQCSLPEHRYCFTCNQRTPHAEVSDERD